MENIYIFHIMRCIRFGRCNVCPSIAKPFSCVLLLPHREQTQDVLNAKLFQIWKTRTPVWCSWRKTKLKWLEQSQYSFVLSHNYHDCGCSYEICYWSYHHFLTSMTLCQPVGLIKERNNDNTKQIHCYHIHRVTKLCVGLSVWTTFGLPHSTKSKAFQI